jgi:hypothetical protein
MNYRWLVLPCLLLVAGCHSRQRFTPISGQDPYLMFDQKTAQSCWGGPAEESRSPASGEFAEGELTPEEAAELGAATHDPGTANPAHLPFCKDLK